MRTRAWLGPAWDPYGELVVIRQEMNRLFDTLLGAGQFRAGERWEPAMDVWETPRELCLVVELAGVPQTEIRLEIADGALTIQGERRPDPAFRQDQLQRMERRHGPFFRSLTLPPGVDAERVRAVCRDGLLEIRLAKRPAAAGRDIRVDVS
ncbi:MAG TPA: Hsp20/alpha crystallin family protein [Candidatus Sulfotelmatobacter sp.]|nr:Hsp20/alpha crystallin family protein [Candidatus Sulfotelmatobacter sp.]